MYARVPSENESTIQDTGLLRIILDTVKGGVDNKNVTSCSHARQ